MSSSLASLVTVIGLWLFVVVLCCGGGKQTSKKVLTKQQRAELQADKDKACSTMNRLQRAGGFTKIEPGYAGVTHAYVDRGFYAIPVDAKETALKAVALCYIDLEKENQTGLVIIHDGYSGKRIGTFDFGSGLDLD